MARTLNLPPLPRVDAPFWAFLLVCALGVACTGLFGIAAVASAGSSATALALTQL